jgi:hypothetical protein
MIPQPLTPAERAEQARAEAIGLAVVGGIVAVFVGVFIWSERRTNKVEKLRDGSYIA